MRSEPDNRDSRRTAEQEEYRRRAEIKAKRRKKRRMQKIMLLGAFALAAVLLVVCVVMIVRAIIKPKDKPAAKSPSTSSSVSSLLESQPLVQTPVAPNADKWELILINQASPMPDGFEPETSTVSSAGHWFDARAAGQLLDMIAACNKEGEGYSLSIASALRGAQTQNNKYNALVDLFKSQGDDEATADKRAREVDPPYPMSDHQTGLGVDFITQKVTEPEQSFAQTPEYAWLMEHAAEYGFILRFPEGKEAITGIKYQPYHFRYVGVEDAGVISRAGICLEEYVVQLPATPPASSTGVSGAGSSAAGSEAG